MSEKDELYFVGVENTEYYLCKGLDEVEEEVNIIIDQNYELSDIKVYAAGKSFKVVSKIDLVPDEDKEHDQYNLPF